MIDCPECHHQVSDSAASCPNCGHPVAEPAVKTVVRPNKPEGTKSVLKFILIAIVALILFKACSDSGTGTKADTTAPVDVQYEIAKVIASNKMSGCGEFTWTANPGQSSEYTVKCSSDGTNWTTYTVWTKVDKIVPGVTP